MIHWVGDIYVWSFSGSLQGFALSIESAAHELKRWWNLLILLGVLILLLFHVGWVLCMCTCICMLLFLFKIIVVFTVKSIAWGSAVFNQLHGIKHLIMYLLAVVINLSKHFEQKCLFSVIIYFASTCTTVSHVKHALQYHMLFLLVDMWGPCCEFLLNSLF